MAVKDMHKGAKGAVICALGPSLQKPAVMREVRKYAKAGWHVFGLKEAITYLREKGIEVHYSANMDPGEKECARTPIYSDVTYCLASSCHPALFQHALDGGAEVLVYHSACGYSENEFKAGFVIDLGGGDHAVTMGEYEMKTVNDGAFSPVFSVSKNEIDVYQENFPNGDVIVGGFTVANRALGLVKYMGFERVVMAGADFGWRENKDTYYAKFVTAEPLRDVFMTDSGRVDGKPWKTRPDLLASAVDVARHIKKGTVKVLGDSLAASFAKKDDDYLDNVVKIQNA